jgi:signal transduction histidine kinase
MLRIIGALFGALLLSSVAVMIIESHLSTHWATQVATGQLRERFRPIFILLEDRLSTVPATALQAEFGQVTRDFNYPARLVAVHEARKSFPLGDDELDLLRRDGIVVFERGKTVDAIRRLSANHELLVVLELPGLQQPLYLKMRFYYGLQAVFMLVSVVLLARWYWRDLSTLKRATKQVAGGAFGAKVEVSRGSLLRPLADDFNHMSSQLNELMRSHRELVSAVSHEMRHPISRMRFHYELALESDDPAAHASRMALLAKDIDELDSLTDEVLTYASLRQVDPLESAEQQPTFAWLGEAVESARNAAIREGFTVRIDIEESIDECRVIAPLMQRAATNLLLNATRHAKSQVSIRVWSEGCDYVLEVADDGPGIPEKFRRQIFQPFVRLDRSRSRSNGTYGMGLAIVERIAKWHGGAVSVGVSSMGGALFQMRWPVSVANDGGDAPSSDHSYIDTAA